jgi:hypothetical protein
LQHRPNTQHRHNTQHNNNNNNNNSNSNGEVHHISDHIPFLKRFAGDWSFLGKTKELGLIDAASAVGKPKELCSIDAPPVTEVIIPTDEKHSQIKLHPWIKPSKMVKRVQSEVQQILNPYKSNKRQRDDYRRPSADIGHNAIASQQSKTNPFSRFAHVSDRKSSDRSGSMQDYWQTREDVRFVKRKFIPAAL